MKLSNWRFAYYLPNGIYILIDKEMFWEKQMKLSNWRFAYYLPNGIYILIDKDFFGAKTNETLKLNICILY
jgi:hypothetical protein